MPGVHETGGKTVVIRRRDSDRVGGSLSVDGARPVHGKGTSHPIGIPTTNDDRLSARFVDAGH